MPEPCTHPEMMDGLCGACGYCLHDVVLNGSCMACGRDDISGTIKRAAPTNVVPLAKLVRKPKDE